jgi:hypothetical protein
VELERICEEIATAITANMDSTPYRQGGVEDTWHETDDVTGDIQNDLTAHLTFSVLPRSSPVTNQRRGDAGDVIRCKSQIEVVFAYHIRVDQQRDDLRLAMRGAREIIAIVNNEALWAGVEDGGDVVVMVRERFRPTLLLTEEPYALVAVGFDIDHDEEI